jgi:hypothetical protein
MSASDDQWPGSGKVTCPCCLAHRASNDPGNRSYSFTFYTGISKVEAEKTGATTYVDSRGFVCCVLCDRPFSSGFGETTREKAAAWILSK